MYICDSPVTDQQYYVSAVYKSSPNVCNTVESFSIFLVDIKLSDNFC